MTVTETRLQAPAAPELTHREILEILVGLLAALFTAMLSSTIVSNALPTIIADLEGSQTQYTWVLTASLLATTVSTPIWGKLSDLMSKKLLVQLAITLFVIGSALAGMAHNVPFLIGARVLQGLAMGGLMALAQAIIGAAIPPRDRGRYSGDMGAVMAVATVSGPLIGGIIVDTSWLGWRWCFYVCVPLAMISLVVLAVRALRRRHDPVRRPHRDGGEPGRGAAGPAQRGPAAHHRARDRGQHGRRGRDVRQRDLSRSVLPGGPRLQRHRIRSADHPDDARIVCRIRRCRPDGDPLRQVEACT